MNTRVCRSNCIEVKNDNNVVRVTSTWKELNQTLNDVVRSRPEQRPLLTVQRASRDLRSDMEIPATTGRAVGPPPWPRSLAEPARGSPGSGSVSQHQATRAQPRRPRPPRKRRRTVQVRGHPANTDRALAASRAGSESSTGFTRPARTLRVREPRRGGLRPPVTGHTYCHHSSGVGGSQIFLERGDANKVTSSRKRIPRHSVLHAGCEGSHPPSQVRSRLRPVLGPD